MSLTLIIVLIILFGYILPFIINSIGYYFTEFKGHTVEEYIEFISKEVNGYLELSPKDAIVCPLINLAVAIYYLIVFVLFIFCLPFKIANRKYNIWAKIKNIKIK